MKPEARPTRDRHAPVANATVTAQCRDRVPAVNASTVTASGLTGALAAVLLAGTMAPPAHADEDGPGMQSYRAVYDFSLADDVAAPNLESVSGQMTGSWTRDCEGWSVTQDIVMTIYDRFGGAVDINSTYAAWEAIDGSSFSFTLDQQSSGFGQERLRGVAIRDGSGGIDVDYRLPEVGSERLDGAVLFPMAHTIEILERAAAGERFFQARVFDGSDTEWGEAGGAYDINAVISDAPMEDADATGDQAGDDGTVIDDAGLRSGPAWRVQLAHFSAGAEVMEPEFETTLRLFRNGVADRIRLDYGSFAVDARLSSIEPLDAPVCR